MKILSIFAFILLLLFTACSTSQETLTKDEETAKEEIYVFDDPVSDLPAENDNADTSIVDKDTLTYVREAPQLKVIEAPAEKKRIFIVQVGAFTTKDKAQSFINQNQKNISFKMNIEYSENVNLFVIWLPEFTSRDEAENVRNSLWEKDNFKDAFILTRD